MEHYFKGKKEKKHPKQIFCIKPFLYTLSENGQSVLSVLSRFSTKSSDHSTHATIKDRVVSRTAFLDIKNTKNLILIKLIFRYLIFEREIILIIPLIWYSITCAHSPLDYQVLKRKVSSHFNNKNQFNLASLQNSFF
ncbi:hypothetical protein BpHYR1_037226 [Brachionus plicatilis]|uniref:Uncharacterized protein n=1 Tax=Brachionus plicatilis TaxID=10195 RepID=A0A3M7PT03_BRAPC|nr:hypothetical protein BpHYR1_037226 [Brachionus plicatilis]